MSAEAWPEKGSHAQTILKSYTGTVEAVEGGHVFLTLHSDGEYYDTKLPHSLFEPTPQVEVGAGVVARRVQRRDGIVTWRVKVIPAEPVDRAEYEKFKNELANQFDGSGF